MIHNRFRGRDGAREIAFTRSRSVASLVRTEIRTLPPPISPWYLIASNAGILMPMIDLVNPPATAPTPAPAKVAMMGPAAISGPTPGIASIPRAIRQLRVPPRTMPLPPPTAAPRHQRDRFTLWFYRGSPKIHRVSEAAEAATH